MESEKDVVIQEEHTKLGSIRIADEVVRIVAGIAATEVPGVAGMSGGIAGGIAEMLGRKNLSRGVKVAVGEHEAAIDIFIIVNYGSRIPDVASQIQARVKKAIEDMTGLAAVEVNVNIQGVVFGELREDEKDSPKAK